MKLLKAPAAMPQKTARVTIAQKSGSWRQMSRSVLVRREKGIMAMSPRGNASALRAPQKNVNDEIFVVDSRNRAQV
jgi:hypothetical protein